MKYLQKFEERLTPLEKRSFKQDLFNFIRNSFHGVTLEEIIFKFPDYDLVMDTLEDFFREETIKYYNRVYTVISNRSSEFVKTNN